MSNVRRYIASKPVIVIYGLSIVFILLNLWSIHHTRPYNSDDVSWQNILLTWRPFNGHQVILGGLDSFILKMPFFWLFGHFFDPTRRLLFLESSFFAVLSFSLFYISAIYFLKKTRAELNFFNLSPLLWFASFGYAIGQLSLNPILRNFELGLSFIYFVLAAKLFYDEVSFKPILNKLVVLLLPPLTGLLIFNDPYFFYFTIIPIVLFYIVFYTAKQIKIRKLYILAALLVPSLIIAKLASLITGRAGVHLAFSQPTQFVTFDNFFNNVSLAIHGLLVIFGADFFGQKVLGVKSIIAILNLIVLLYIFYKGCSLLRGVVKNRKIPRDALNAWCIFLVILGFFVLSVFIFSDVAVDLYSYRYLIMLVYAFILFLTLSFNQSKLWIRIIVVIAIVANCGNILLTKTESVQPGSKNNTANSENIFLIDTLKSTGIKKGYATYWDGNINSYLSKGSIEFLPVICVTDKTIPNNFLVDTTLFGQSSAKSFYIFDPELNFPPACSEEAVKKQFGNPTQTLYIGSKKVFLYSYDIRQKM